MAVARRAAVRPPRLLPDTGGRVSGDLQSFGIIFCALLLQVSCKKLGGFAMKSKRRRLCPRPILRPQIKQDFRNLGFRREILDKQKCFHFYRRNLETALSLQDEF